VDLVQLGASAYQLQGGANVGLVVQEGRALVVDAGLDRDSGRRVVRAAEELGASVAAVIITHAHADHFGGAAEIKRRTGAPVYAPAFEAAIVENPMLEAYYLFGGAQPPAELLGKFTVGPACAVDGHLAAGAQTLAGFAVEAIPMPGHAQNQMMVAVGEVCFAADAFFQPAVLEKYGIPFYVDAAQAHASLDRLAALDGRFAWFVPGHGPAVAEAAPVVRLNQQRIEAIMDHVRRALEPPAEASTVLARVAEALGVTIAGPTVYYLTMTTIQGCLSHLQVIGEAQVEVMDRRAVWSRRAG